MRHPLLSALLAALGLACGDADPPDARAPDAGPADLGTHLDAGACALDVLDEEGRSVSAVDLKVGARRSLRISGGATEVAVSTPALGHARVADGALALFAGYTAGVDALVLTGSCPDGPRERGLQRTVSPLRFRPVPAWTPGDDGPVAREYFSMWVDPLEPDALWVYGGFHYAPRQFTPGQDVWRLDLSAETWTAHPDGPVEAMPGAGLAPHPDGYVLRYGGLNVGQLPDPAQVPFSLHRARTSTAGLAFEAVSPANAPTFGDYQPAFFLHPPSGRFLAACGANEVRGGHCDVSAFDPATETWSEVPTEGTAPEGRNGHFWAYDGVTDRLIVFSGEGFPPSSGCDNCLQDTWALQLSASPPRWARLFEDGSGGGPVGRRNGAYVLDPLNHRLLVWGGTADGRTSTPGLFALDLAEGEEAWYEVPTEGVAPVRTSGGAVFDPAQSRVLMGFGNGARIYADLWVLDVSNP